jgi:hypothetical protein
VFLELSVLLPVVLIAGFCDRRPAPAAAKPIGERISVISETNGYWQTQKIQVRILRGPAEPGIRVQLLPKQELAAPDVLVYWSRRLPEQDSLPLDARLLGRLDSSASYRLPEVSGGHLVLFSLPLNRVIDSTSLGLQP